MIRATLTPPSITPELTLHAVRELMRHARAGLVRDRKKGRQKARRYAVYIRSRNRTKGYQEGLIAAGSRITAVIEGLRNTYEDAIDKARNDMHAAARAIAEQVIPTRLLSDPQIFEHWVNEAVVLLKRSKTLQITYHPQYHDIMQQVAQKLPAGIALAADHTAQEYAFAINGDVGGIEFTWTSPLEQIEQPRPPTGFPT